MGGGTRPIRDQRQPFALGASVDFLLRGGFATVIYEPRSVEIPTELSEVAEELGLSYRQTLMILDVDRCIVARRNGRTERRKSKDIWRALYEAVSPFIEDAR